MMNDKNVTRASNVLHGLNDLLENAGSAERQKITGWISALHAAENAARAKPNARLHDYLINHRIKEVRGKTKGSADQRRDALVELIESLTPREKHLSTSSWIVRLHIEQAKPVLDLLKPPLASFDYVAVIQITANRAAYGDSDLD